MGRGRLTDDIRSVREGDTAGIAFPVCKNLGCPVLPDHHRFCGIEVIASIFFCLEGRYKVSRKSGPGQQIRIRLAPVVRRFDKLERLFLYLFHGHALPLHGCGQVSLITAHKVMLGFIRQIPHRRRDLFHIVTSKIQVLNGRLPLFIRCQGSHPLAGMVQNSGLAVRVDNILTGIKSVDRFF